MYLIQRNICKFESTVPQSFMKSLPSSRTRTWPIFGSTLSLTTQHSLHFLPVQSLTVWGENLGRFLSTHTPWLVVYMCVSFWILRNMLELFRALWHPIPQLFLSSVWLACCLPLLFICCHRCSDVKHWPLIVFDKSSQRKYFFHWAKYPSQNYQFSGNETLKELQSPFALFCVYQAVGFYHDCSLLVFKDSTQLERRGWE